MNTTNFVQSTCFARQWMMADSINKNVQVSLWPLCVAAVVSCRKPWSGSNDRLCCTTSCSNLLLSCLFTQNTIGFWLLALLSPQRQPAGKVLCCQRHRANWDWKRFQGTFRLKISYWRKLQKDTDAAVMRRDLTFTTHRKWELGVNL